ncbi:exodeoxyribonuclease-5 [Methylobacterium sp. BE186]|uniref:UvrD-helicase domain-containing protein n=1 Tax=Methylobacterium sp. BE186 TaxID=2817715 RepID=UPI00285CDF42|nr:UvrD-helicase domain-containing protein [Methylobacterium sp. BE186]MDR7037979.1 exodeoxyribonuclease-5 [Methylobacterium sp. BE186]
MTTHDKLLADGANRILAISDSERSMLVEAGAGSGKTALMAGRIAMMLASGIEPRSIAAVTFTELAASELATRVANVVVALIAGAIPVELAAVLPAGLGPEQREHLGSAERHLDELTCTTIHGFCQRLIAPYPVEADIDPGAVVIDQAEAERIFEDLVDAWLREKLSRTGGLIAEMVLVDPADTLETVRRVASCLRENRRVGTRPAEPVDRLAEDFVRQVAAFAEFVARAPAREEETAAAVQALQTMTAIRMPTRTMDPRTLVAFLATPAEPSLCKKDGGFYKFKGGKIKWAAAAKAVGLSKDEANRLQLSAATHYETCCDIWERLKANVASEVLGHLVVEVRPVLEDFRLRKRAGGLLDFGDLIHAAARLLREHDDVRAALAGRYRYVLVDEFQDTDPLQTEIFWRLCGEAPDGAADVAWHGRILRPGALFLVGDPKQAIYRFRGADVSAYVRARAAVEADADALVVPVSTNFRSCRSILAYVNDTFGNVLDGPGQPGFSALDPFHEDHDRGPCVAALDVVVEQAGAKPTSNEARDAEAEAVADLCARLIGQAVTTCKIAGTRVVQPGDIALLAPTGSDLWRYEEALERRGIPVATQAGKGFFRRQEVQDLIAITRILADPRDTLALGAFLRGPVVGLTDEDLLDIVHAVSEGPEAAEQPVGLSLHLDTDRVAHPVARAIFEKLQSIAKLAAGTTPHDILSRAVDAFMLRPIVLHRHDGHSERALANIDLYLEMARPYAVRGLRAFARAMQVAWEGDTRAVEGRPDAQEAAVGLFTMHASKGLEWPIVIPVNTLTQAKSTSGLVVGRTEECLFCPVFSVRPAGYEEALQNEDQAIKHERVRLWYVAATRAREVLILPRLPVAGSKSSWSSVVNLELDKLPRIDLDKLPAAARPPVRIASNGQTPEIFAAEAAAIVGLHRSLRCLAPSRDGAAAVFAPPEPDVISAEGEASLPAVQGSRTRGVIIHKLLEECLTGETAGETDAVVKRALELIESLGLEPTADPLSGPSPTEIGTCVVKTLELPAISAIRSRLRPEIPVYGFQSIVDEDVATFGVVDAVAFDEAGTPEIVVDWKSDVAADPATVASYRGQLGQYLDMTGAGKGLLVFVSSGEILPVHRAT